MYFQNVPMRDGVISAINIFSNRRACHSVICTRQTTYFWVPDARSILSKYHKEYLAEPARHLSEDNPALHQLTPKIPISCRPSKPQHSICPKTRRMHVFHPFLPILVSRQPTAFSFQSSSSTNSTGGRIETIELDQYLNRCGPSIDIVLSPLPTARFIFAALPCSAVKSEIH